MTNPLRRRGMAAVAILLAGACRQMPDRPCTASLIELMPKPDTFAADAGMTTPDRGVSAESGAHPSSVCSVGYSLRGGTIATLNLYKFEEPSAAETGFKNLAAVAGSINPDFDTPVEPLEVTDAAPHADGLYIECHMRAGDTYCTVVARYAVTTYWLSVSHLAASGFTEADLARVVDALDGRLTTRQ